MLLDVEPQLYESEYDLQEARKRRAKFSLIPMYLIVMASFISIHFVREKLTRKTTLEGGGTNDGQVILLQAKDIQLDDDDEFQNAAEK